MTKPERNAAIYYVSDGYDPESKGLNGRRFAGASFLKGFFRHADVAEFVSVSQGEEGREAFLAVKNRYAPATPHRVVYEYDPTQIAPIGTIYYPAPNYAEQCWRRHAIGMNSYSICGIVHTTATQAVMRGFFDLRAGPQAEWDAVICTSRAAHAATLRNIEVADAFLRDRFGHVPPRPQMPVIPLGINTEEFEHDAKAAAYLRKRMSWDEDDIVVVTIARLLPYGKFDPGPVFVALEKAQQILGKSKRLRFAACGIFADKHSEIVYRDCARRLMPSVIFNHLAGGDPVVRKETLSGGDIFVFPIDNVQETFGLSPIEAMAAGLPVIASDWDGIRDTVTPDVGIRVPTRSVEASATLPEARGYLSGSLSYPQYGNRLSMITEVDMPPMIDAFVSLARNKDLRMKMGHAGQIRARTEYDWSVIIPKMQDFWAELNSIRLASQEAADKYPGYNPVAPLPMDLFESYPSTFFESYS